MNKGSQAQYNSRMNPWHREELSHIIRAPRGVAPRVVEEEWKSAATPYDWTFLPLLFCTIFAIALFFG